MFQLRLPTALAHPRVVAALFLGLAGPLMISVVVAGLSPVGSAEASGLCPASSRMAQERYAHTATLLANGRALVAGGEANDLKHSPQLVASAEIYDPAHGTWSGTGGMARGRRGHTATVLAD